MAHLALGLAVSAVIAAALPAPGGLIAIGLGIAALGTGWVGYHRSGDPGFRRLCGAAGITVGALACLLGTLRVALTLAAIDHLERLLG